MVIARHWSTVERLTGHLSQNSYEVSGSTDIDQAVQQLKHQHIDIALLDWADTHERVISLCEQLRLVSDEVYVVAVIQQAEAAYRISALDAGADDCLSRPLNLQELDARLRAYCRRIGTVGREIYQFADLMLNPRTREVYRGQYSVTLTAKEFDLLKYLMRHPQQVMTRHQILEHVWGYDFAGDSNIIEVYIRYLRLKLEVHNPRRLIHTVRYVGYVLREPSQPSPPHKAV
ncbi:MAG: response regulator transcription factor [Elainellaceae cyanobacterium]